jgi:galactose mutarotase-like enzyme
MEYQIENNILQVKVSDQGAELLSIIGKHSQHEYLWQATADNWRWHAPILFPIVGKLKDDHYLYQGKAYAMPQHGFARKQKFKLKYQTKDSITFSLQDNAATRAIYPFHFELEVNYTLLNDLLEENFSVKNLDPEQEMLFSLGGHPGFNVPVKAGVNKEDFYFKFQPSNARIRVPYQGKFLDWDQRYLASTNSLLALRDSLFKDDALIYQMRGHDNKLAIRTDSSDFHINIWSRNAPFLGIWSPYPKVADFVCIECLWGIADTVDSDGILAHKKGIQYLPAGQVFNTGFSMTFHGEE